MQFLSTEIRLRVPDGFPEAVNEAARRECSNLSAYVRGAVLQRLREDGVPFEPAKQSHTNTPTMRTPDD